MWKVFIIRSLRFPSALWICCWSHTTLSVCNMSVLDCLYYYLFIPSRFHFFWRRFDFFNDSLSLSLCLSVNVLFLTGTGPFYRMVGSLLAPRRFDPYSTLEQVLLPQHAAPCALRFAFSIYFLTIFCSNNCSQFFTVHYHGVTPCHYCSINWMIYVGSTRPYSCITVCTKTYCDLSTVNHITLI